MINSIHSILTVGIQLKMSKNGDEAKLTQFFKDTVDKLGKLEYINFKADEKTRTITLFHHDMEVSGILKAAGLPRETFPRVEITENILSITLDNRPKSNFSLFFECYHQLKKARELLLIQAESMLKSRKNLSDVTFDGECGKDESPLELFEGFFKKYDGICFGEAHQDVSPKINLIAMMPYFAKVGVTTLYMEHLFYDTMQPMLNGYLKSKKAMPIPLKAYLKKQDKGQRGSFNSSYIETRKTANYFQLVKTAKENGIRIVGIDTTISYATGQSSNRGVQDSLKRYIAMNATATSIIEENQKMENAGKYIILLGSGHMSKIRVKNRVISGVATLLKIPSVLLSDSKRDKLEVNINTPVFATLSLEINPTDI